MHDVEYSFGVWMHNTFVRHRNIDVLALIFRPNEGSSLLANTMRITNTMTLQATRMLVRFDLQRADLILRLR